MSHSPLGKPIRGVSATPIDDTTHPCSPLWKDTASFRQVSLVSDMRGGTRIESSQDLLLRSTPLTPLVQRLHDIDRMLDFELGSLAIIGVPCLKRINGPLDVGLGTRVFHLDV